MRRWISEMISGNMMCSSISAWEQIPNKLAMGSASVTT